MEMKNEMAEELLKWIEEQKEDFFTCESFETQTEKGLKLKTEYAEAVINITPLEYTVVEYRIRSKADEDVFYLHFELNDLEHAKELFAEMKECLRRQHGNEVHHVLLCCTCGLTTSYFTMKLNEIAKVLDVKMDFDAVPYERLYEKAVDKDAVLIAPQIGYQYKNVCSVLKDKIVLKIPVQIFSTYDGAAMITMLKEEFEKQQPGGGTKKSDIVSLKESNGSLLIVSVIDIEGRNQIAYRLYDHGEVSAENQITKEKYSFTDIEDAVQLVIRMNPQIETICIVTPGMTAGGKLTYEKAGIFDLNVVESMENQFGKKTYLFNDTDMIALGYAHKERNGDDTAFYFVPTGSHVGNIGIVVNGRLVRGARHMGGRQLDGITNITTFPQNPYSLVRTPEGNIELAARYITGLYSYTGIEHIAYYSSMIPDAEELKKKLSAFIGEKYLPDIVKVESIRQYLYQGVLKSIEEESEE